MPDVLIPGDNLTLEGIPPIPKSLADTLRRYPEFRAAGFANWHPTRREMLIRTRFAETFQVHRVAFPGGDRQQMTFFADTVMRRCSSSGRSAGAVGVRDGREQSRPCHRSRP